MWLVASLFSLAMAQPPDPGPPAGLVPLVGSWQVDWSSSTGVDAMLSAQGVPGVVRAIATRAKVQQDVQWMGDGEVVLRRHLPIGSITEALRTDGRWQSLASKLGDHEVKVDVTEAGMTLERAFEDYVLTERWTREGEVLVSRRTLVYPDGRTLASTLRLTAVE